MQPRFMLIIGVLVLTAGCVGGPTADSNQSAGDANAHDEEASNVTGDTTNESANLSALDSQLKELINADDRAAVATQYGLELRENEVQAVIELRSEADRATIEEQEVEIVAESGTQIQAWIPIGELTALSTMDAVRFIRAPDRPTQSDLQS